MTWLSFEVPNKVSFEGWLKKQLVPRDERDLSGSENALSGSMDQQINGRTQPLMESQVRVRDWKKTWVKNFCKAVATIESRQRNFRSRTLAQETQVRHNE